jgi:hypothetical protein
VQRAIKEHDPLLGIADVRKKRFDDHCSQTFARRGFFRRSSKLLQPGRCRVSNHLFAGQVHPCQSTTASEDEGHIAGGLRFQFPRLFDQTARAIAPEDHCRLVGPQSLRQVICRDFAKEVSRSGRFQEQASQFLFCPLALTHGFSERRSCSFPRRGKRSEECCGPRAFRSKVIPLVLHCIRSILHQPAKSITPSDRPA